MITSNFCFHNQCQKYLQLCLEYVLLFSVLLNLAKPCDSGYSEISPWFQIKGDQANLSLFYFPLNLNISIKSWSKLKSNTIFEILIEFCVSWYTIKLHLSKYEGNDKHNTDNIIIDKPSLSQKSFTINHWSNMF